MKIIIAGSGDTGTHLAKMLAKEKQDVILMSDHSEYLKSIDSSYNLITYNGDPCSPSDLRSAGVPDADMFIAVTPYGTRNMIACQLAKHLGAGSTIARVEDNDFTAPDIADTFAHSGIDTMVYPESLVVNDILDYTDHNWMVCRHDIHQGKLTFAGIRITESSPLAGLCLRDMGDDRQFHIVAIRRQRKTIIPSGSDSLLPGDTAYITFASQHYEAVKHRAGLDSGHIRHIIITGHSNLVALLLERLASRRVSISLLSPDEDFCLKMAGRFPNVAVSHASSADIHTLQDEGIRQCDLFIAMESTASENIIAAITAKELGVKRTIAQIEDLQYIAEAERLGIDKIVNKKLITSAVILRSIMGSQLQVRSMISLDNAEVVELEVAQGSAITKDMVCALRIPQEMTLGGLVHNGEATIITGRTQIQPGDRVLIVFRPGTLNKVVKLFRPKTLLR